MLGNCVPKDSIGVTTRIVPFAVSVPFAPVKFRKITAPFFHSSEVAGSGINPETPTEAAGKTSHDVPSEKSTANPVMGSAFAGSSNIEIGCSVIAPENTDRIPSGPSIRTVFGRLGPGLANA